ncbi:hypothetical protein MESS4_280061 [Mesorhizobium sp. STM 4661]|nr:hypothetical protein MESS4_280061 [Mesorhizobium sp. STM 4661]
MLLVVGHRFFDRFPPRRVGEHIVADAGLVGRVERFEKHDGRAPWQRRIRIDRTGHAMVVQDVTFDRCLVPGFRQAQKADAAQAGEVLVDIERAEERLELAARNVAIAGVEQRLGRSQQRQMQVDAALDPVERVVRRRLELDARRLLRGEIGESRHHQADQRDGDESDNREELLQLLRRPMVGSRPLWATPRVNTMARPIHHDGWHITQKKFAGLLKRRPALNRRQVKRLATELGFFDCTSHGGIFVTVGCGSDLP